MEVDCQLKWFAEMLGISAVGLGIASSRGACDSSYIPYLCGTSLDLVALHLDLKPLRCFVLLIETYILLFLLS